MNQFDVFFKDYAKRSPPEVFFFLSKFIEITFLHGCSSVNLQYIFRILFLNNTSWYYFYVYQRSEEYLFSKTSYKQPFLFVSSLRKVRLHIFFNSYTLLIFT